MNPAACFGDLGHINFRHFKPARLKIVNQPTRMIWNDLAIIAQRHKITPQIFSVAEGHVNYLMSPFFRVSEDIYEVCRLPTHSPALVWSLGRTTDVRYDLREGPHCGQNGHSRPLSQCLLLTNDKREDVVPLTGQNVERS
mgnify:FL=1